MENTDAARRMRADANSVDMRIRAVMLATRGSQSQREKVIVSSGKVDRGCAMSTRLRREGFNAFAYRARQQSKTYRGGLSCMISRASAGVATDMPR